VRRAGKLRRRMTLSLALGMSLASRCDTARPGGRRSKRMGLLRTLAATAVGAAAMYYFDPAAGRARRSRLQRSLAGGAAAPPRDDRQLRDRIRSRLGRLVRRPRDVEVVVNDGYVSLRGEVSADERERLLGAVVEMPGVRQVDNRLAVPDEMPRTLARPDSMPPDRPAEGVS
jgi:hypothetical protein